MKSKHSYVVIICISLVTGLVGFGIGVAVQKSRSNAQYSLLEASQPAISAELIDQQVATTTPTVPDTAQTIVETGPIVRTSFTGTISAITSTAVTIERPGDSLLPKSSLTFTLEPSIFMVDAKITEVQPGLPSVQEVDISRDNLQKGDIITAYSASDIFADPTPSLTKLQRFAEYTDVSELTETNP